MPFCDNFLREEVLNTLANTPDEIKSFASIAMPLVRRTYSPLLASEFVSVQPMNVPSGEVFYMDYHYGDKPKPKKKKEEKYSEEFINKLRNGKDILLI